ncbi:hypothetical protein BCR32DRAFT_281406 [Anaeromyces robustus]|jgi:hypothetical protein|uniref:MSP domain-containing protein n=1 Tax=Anaeromyces robustus TaxID=1754192 RepID=A0A1Y1X0W4_9FUNG|nr:hypothetical protein BCR32DRAFT_281406 [Anaeromyces robustus]|eukprot:ORX79403.1 hypothetical protein BCR32DRAFT_281406 [Anaeromyces robustus]
MDFITFEPNKSLRFVKKSSSRNLDETGSPKNESYAKAMIIIHNSSEDKVAGFKIKTTSPHNFCVRPSVGKILPKNDAEVLIMIKVHDLQQKLNKISSDKFLIQTTVVPDEFRTLKDEECTDKIGDIFKKLEKSKKSGDPDISKKLKEHRLLCDISGLPVIKTDETKKETSTYSPETPNTKDKLVSPLSANASSPVKKTAQTNENKVKYNELLEKNPQNINEANAIIKELESAIQKYSVDSLKDDLVKTRRYGKESINGFTADGKKEINDPKELFFEWKDKAVGKRKLPLDKSIQWPIAFLIVVVAFIIGAYSF